ncbi:MAG: LysM peptidoglycan-binding domain-containing protein [Bacteroidetes bacterium]|nr:LysM peptidoglycan-binding domain-containing protein [Bacteroidota bacterium]
MKKQLLIFFLVFNALIYRSQTKSDIIKVIDGNKYYIHKIDKGQSLYSISKTYSVSLDEIYQLNPETKQGVKAGYEIKIPCLIKEKKQEQSVKSNSVAPKYEAEADKAVDTSKYVWHKVEKGETLYGIQHKYKISETELRNLNGNTISTLKEGQIILLQVKQSIKNNHFTEVKSVDAHINLDTNQYKKQKKEAYSIALILPFKTDIALGFDIQNAVKNKMPFPQISALAVDFYLGFKMMMDSLQAKNFETNLDIYDFDEKDSLKNTELLSSSKFKQYDFIFGPLYSGSFKNIAQKAKEYHIPIVSPLVQQNKILYNNIFASKVTPSQYTLMESLADYIIDSLIPQKAKIILAQSNDTKETKFVKDFKKYYLNKIQSKNYSINDTIQVVKGISGVKSAYRSDTKNIVVTLSSNQVFLMDFITQLAIFSQKKDVTLCGWHNISQIENIDQEYLNQLKFTFPYQNNVINIDKYAAFTEQYKQRQNILPSDYFYVAIDIASYYLGNLKETGPEFIYNLDKHDKELNFTRFKYTRPDTSTGFDNRGTYLFYYSDYKLKLIGWK